MNAGRWLPCYKCKEDIYLTSPQEETLRRNQCGFFCRWGHEQYFAPGKTDVQKAQEERDAAIRQRDSAIQQQARLSDERDAAERKASAAKGQVTKLRNRAAAGVCPCCNRSFVQLARHMTSKHPNFSGEDVQ